MVSTKARGAKLGVGLKAASEPPNLTACIKSYSRTARRHRANHTQRKSHLIA